MPIDVAGLRARWTWAGVLALIAFSVMGWVDSVVKEATGLGIMNLQFAATPQRAGEILGVWTAAGMIPHVSFSLGLDYLLMPLYGATFFYGALVAREAFPRQRGVFTLLAWVGPLAAALDMLENAVHAGMVMGMTSPTAVAIQYPATLAKWVLLALGLVIGVIAMAGLPRLRRG